tara:strand:+ start:235 stop:939 length:705 start_codon:yes stop_codon:yes gene_type:complete
MLWDEFGGKNATELKKYEKDKLLSESKKDKIIKKLGDEVMTVMKDNLSVISSAYRDTVQSNSFGKKNYKKFTSDLIEFIEDQSTIIELKEELNFMHDIEYELTIDKSTINWIEDEINKAEKNIEYDNSIDPYEYEYFCAAQFKKFGWKAEATKGSSDQGVDVKASKEGVNLVAQCKKFAKPVGNKAVQEIVAGIKYYKADVGVVIAPNGYTKSAKKLAEANSIKLIHHSEISSL